MPRSQFQDTFTKTDGDKNLQYDDSAFYYFASAVLSLAFVALVVSLIRQHLAKRRLRLQDTPLCPCGPCKHKLSELVKYRRHTSTFYLKVLACAVVAYLAFASVTKAAENKSFKSFDPWEIMDLVPNTPVDQIKRKYKQMALKLHPDRNKDEDAVQKLILLNKAYTCLTNPEAAANCGNFGDPDGKTGSFEVGIALPSFLLRKKNRVIILALFFILILIVAPLVALYFYQNSDNKDKNGISVSVQPFILEVFRNDNVLFKNFIEIMSVVDELGPLRHVTPNQVADLEKIARADPEFVPKFGLARFKAFLKPFYVLRAFMNDGHVPPSLRGDLVEMLKVLCRVVDTLFDFSLELYTNPYAARTFLGKPLSFNIVDRVIIFSQHFYQGLWLHDSPLMQLPSFRREVIEQAKRKLKKADSIPALRQNGQAAQTLQAAFGNDPFFRLEDDLAALDAISDFELECKVFTGSPEDPESDIHIGDMFTAQINIRRRNKRNGFIHSNWFPLLKREAVLLMIVDGPSNRLLLYKRLVSDGSLLTHEWKDVAETPGNFKLKVIVRSDCYIGVDIEGEMRFSILNSKREPGELFQLHPDDEKAAREATFMRSLIDDIKGNEENSDDEVEEPEGPAGDATKALEGAEEEIPEEKPHNGN